MKTLALFLLLALSVQGQTVTVDPATSFQTITGWEATSQAGQIDFPSNFAVYASSLFDQTIEMGVNRVRLELQADMENSTPRPTHVAVNDNGDPNSYNAAGFNWTEFDSTVSGVVVPMRNRLIARGESLFVNLCYVDFLNNGGSFYHCNDAAEYAELVLAAFDRMSSNWSFVPDAMEIILEPEAGNNTSRWTAAKIASCLAATQTRLAAGGYHPTFILPSTTSCPNMATWYADFKTANPNLTQYYSEVSFHLYSTCNSTQLHTNRDAAQADGKRIAMLECWSNAGCTNDYTVMHTELGPDGNVSSWQPAVVAYPNGGAANTASLFGVDGSNVVTINAASKYYRQYWKWVRQGAVRKATSNSDSNFDGLAFRNTNGSYAVVVNCATSGSFTIAGLPAGTYNIVYTTGAAYNVGLASQTIAGGGSISTSIPAAGVLTVFTNVQSGLSGTAKLSGAAKVQ